MDTGLTGRVAVVTGAASGIGRATARALAAEGCRVVAVDRQEPATPYPADWSAISADVAETRAPARIVAEAIGLAGGVDILVPCAGVYETHAPADLDEAEFDRVYAINVRSVFGLAQAAIAEMGRHGWGRVVLLSSIAAETGGDVAGAAYVASKAAVVGLTRSLARAGGPLGVTVNCVHPGIIQTPMTAVMTDETKRQLAAATPLRRLGTPEDVADVIVMLCSAAGRYVTGARIDVNGGLAMS